MRRREFIAGLTGATAWPIAARAQPTERRPLIGFLSPISAEAATRYVEAFRQGMRDLGYAEGQNFDFALRFADGRSARLQELAKDLVALNPAVIIAGHLQPSAPCATQHGRFQ